MVVVYSNFFSKKIEALIWTLCDTHCYVYVIAYIDKDVASIDIAYIGGNAGEYIYIYTELAPKHGFCSSVGRPLV